MLRLFTWSFVLAAWPVLGSLLIAPGGTWTASNGEHLNAHGGGVIRVNGTFYLIGEDKQGGAAFANVNCFSSPDLVRWTYEGALLSRGQGPSDLGAGRIIERPKVLFNDKTGKYVLWMHVDSSSYGEAKVGVATGDTVCGKYKSFRPLGFESRDIGLFKDDDGSAYLLTEDRKNGVRINKLTDDYLHVKEATYLWKDHIEAPAMIKIKGRYYFFGSHLSGWDPNDNIYSSSTSLASGWTEWKTFADAKSNTYASQTHFVLAYGDASGDAANVVYMGDRWRSKNLQSSSYVWLPLAVGGDGAVRMKNRDAWAPNVGAGGAWAEAPAAASYEGEDGAYAGGAREVACTGCSGGKAAGYIGGTDGGKVTFSGVKAGRDGLTTVLIRYSNGESKPRYANVVVNGAEPVRLAFEPNCEVSTLAAYLRAGSDNKIEIGGASGGGWGPDIDRLLIPTQ